MLLIYIIFYNKVLLLSFSERNVIIHVKTLGPMNEKYFDGKVLESPPVVENMLFYSL